MGTKKKEKNSFADVVYNLDNRRKRLLVFRPQREASSDLGRGPTAARTKKLRITITTFFLSLCFAFLEEDERRKG